MKRDIKTVAGARTRVRVEIVRDAGDVREVEPVLRVAVGNGMELRYACGFFELPALEAGRYDYELLLDGSPLVRGAVSVRASVCCEGALVDGVLWVDLPCWFFVVSRGPRGEVGPRGFSAYELAGQHGYEGSEEDWVAELEGAQAAATRAKEQATAAERSSTAAAGSATTASEGAAAATTEADRADAAADRATTEAGRATTEADRATTEAGRATTEANRATTEAGRATTGANRADAAADRADAAMEKIERNFLPAAEEAKQDAQIYAGDAASSATEAGNQANAASKSAADAAATLANAAKVGANNEFTATNTFDGALVANVSLLYKQQELGYLLNYPVAAWLLENGLHPASALATSWNEWVALNPNWESLGTLIFYAPLMQGDTIPEFEKIHSPLSQCTFISPANVGGKNCQYLLSKNITLYSLKEGSCSDVYNCYHVKKCFFYVPKVTNFNQALNAVGFSNSGVELELSIYAPQLRDIYLVGGNTSFWRLGLLKSFSIHAPKLVSSFNFSRQTDSGKGQTCAILHALIDGIGKPTTEQTITTLAPSDGDEVQTVDGVEKTKKDILREAAATKNWKFIIPAKDAEGNNITIDL